MSNQDNRTQIPGEAELHQGIQFFQQKKYDEGFQAFMKAALKGHPGAMNNLAYCFYNGQGTEVDATASFMWMKKSAEAGFTPAFFALAVKYLKGDGTQKSLTEAVNWARKANVEGNIHQEKAQELLKQIENALENSPIGQARKQAASGVNQGLEFIKEKKYKEAFHCFMSAAMVGDLNAMHNVSLCYASGQGVEQSDKHSFWWMQRSAEGGFPLAFFPLAEKYMNGKGTEQSLEQAEIWARKAAQVQTPFTPNALALLKIIEHENSFSPEVKEALAKGNELWNKKEYEAAVEQLEIAGRAGHAAALRLIGLAYLNGFGVNTNPGHAFRFLEASAYRGDRIAAVIIARAFNGVNKVALWQDYAQKLKLEGCENVFDVQVAKEQKVKRGFCVALNASQAMEQAATVWRDAENKPELMAQSASMGAMMARPCFEKALNYGNLDGACGIAAVFESVNNPAYAHMPLEIYKIAGYMGHSYAMYRLGQHYDQIDENVANNCYRIAAHWKYQPAMDVCTERNITWV